MNSEKKTIIRMENIHKAFKNKVVLNGINLEVYEGEILCIIGRSGIGKSVLIKHITRLLDPDQGEIFFHGKKVRNFNKAELFELRKEVSMLFQSGALFDSMNVEDNLSLPLREHTQFSEQMIADCVSEKLEMVGMPGVQKLKPSELSGGMKKRVGLARSIIMEPKVIMYDEPTTGLDPIMSDVINKLITGLNDRLHTTSIVITHDMNSVKAIADRVAMIHCGKIIFTGSVTDLFNSNDLHVKSFVQGNSQDTVFD